MAESKDYMTLPEENGTISISEKVIAAIAVAAAREVDGVSGMAGGLGGSILDLTNKKNAQKVTDGVKIEMRDEGLTVDLYLCVAYGHTIPEVGESVQKAVAESIASMTGCTAQVVNVHVTGVTLG